MIFWFGYGILPAIVIFADSLIANLITDQIMNEPGFYDRDKTAFGISLLVSCVILAYFTKYFAKKKEEKKGTRVFDWVTIAAGDKNHLFFIPFKYWSYICGIVGLCILLARYFGHH
jgi:hypothetical protein